MALRNMICAFLIFWLAVASHVGASAADPETHAPPWTSAPDDIAETVEVADEHACLMLGDEVLATVPRGCWLGVMERRGNWVAVQVAVGSAIERGWIHARHLRTLEDSDIDLATVALRLARELRPQMDVPAYRARLNALMARIAEGCAVAKSPRERVALIGQQLFGREGFSQEDGIRTLRGILDDRRGDCLELSLLYLLVAGELDMPLHLVASPGHAFLRYDDGREKFNIETLARGQIVDSDEQSLKIIGPRRAAQIRGIYLRNLTRAQAVAVLTDDAGLAFRKLGKLPEASEQFARAIEIFPRWTGPYVNWANALCLMGQCREATTLYALAVEADPGASEAYANWAHALVGLGDYEQAAEKGRRAVEANPQSSAALVSWGRALSATGAHEAACEKYAGAVDLDPGSAVAHYNWGIALFRMDRFEQACEKYAQAVRLYPESVDAYVQWGAALSLMHRPGEASAKYAKAAELDPQNARILVLWGMALGDMGRQAEAAEKWQRALEIDPSVRALLRRTRDPEQEE